MIYLLFLVLFVCNLFPTPALSPSAPTGLNLQLPPVNSVAQTYNITFYVYPSQTYVMILISNATNFRYLCCRDTVNFTAGNYTILADVNPPCPVRTTPYCYAFVRWNVTGGVSVVNPYNGRTTAMVTGPGTLTDVNRAITEHSIPPISVLLGISISLIASSLSRRSSKPKISDV